MGSDSDEYANLIASTYHLHLQDDLGVVGPEFQANGIDGKGLQVFPGPKVVEVVEYADSHLLQRGESRIHASCKSAGSQG